jgi:hypothetical protein
MKSRAIHENLDTSFVNLPALIRYLRRRQFAGRVRIELSGYEADIHLSSENQMRVREYDQIAGRVAEGDEALQRILIRSREPGGIVNVYQTVAETDPVPVVETSQSEPQVALPKASASSPVPASKDFYANGNGAQFRKEEPVAAAKPSLPNLPFEFSNNVEAKAKAKTLSPEETKLLLNLVGELLGTADRALSMAKLNFPNAYHKACIEICADYPFLMSLEYAQGKVTVPEMPSAKIFVAGVLAALKRILDRLGSHPKFIEVHRFSAQKLTALANHRKSYYQKYEISSQLHKILGV